MTWTIEAKVLPIALLSGHLYLEVFNEKGVRVIQINGLAMNPANKQPRSVGLPGDLLQAYVTNDGILPGTFDATRDYHPHDGTVLFRGTQQEIMKAVKAAEEAAAQINQLGLRYNVFVENSNSVFMHIVDAIASVTPIDFQSLEAVRRMKPIFPGIDKEILGRGYHPLKQRFNRQSAKKQPELHKKTPPQPPQL